MQKLWLLLAGCLVLAFCDRHYKADRLDRDGGQRWNIFSFILLLTLVLFAGLRTRYNDTENYFLVYEKLPLLSGFWTDASLALGDNPGFALITSLLKTYVGNRQVYILFWSALTLTCYLFYFRKYSPAFLLTVFLMIAGDYFLFTLAAIKQSAAIALGLLASHFALKKKWTLFLCAVFLATTIHPYALMYLILPLFTHRPWKMPTYLLIIAFLGSSLFMPRLVSTVINVTSLLGEEFTEESFKGQGLNIFRFAIAMAPVLISLFFRRRLFDEEIKASEKLAVNASILNACISFLGLFGTANYFGRLAMYFGVWNVIALPFMLKKLDKSAGKWLTALSVLGYLGVFIYSNRINSLFDQSYAGLSLGEFLAGLF